MCQEENSTFTVSASKLIVENEDVFVVVDDVEEEEKEVQTLMEAEEAAPTLMEEEDVAPTLMEEEEVIETENPVDCCLHCGDDFHDDSIGRSTFCLQTGIVTVTCGRCFTKTVMHRALRFVS